MKFLLFLSLSVFLINISEAQTIAAADLKTLKAKEDSMITFSKLIVEGRSPEECLRADSIFTKILVRALKVKNSYYYSFDSLSYISRIAPQDKAFKIFTWQVALDENSVRQHGAIQMKTADGSLKLFPLIDKSDVIEQMDTVTNNLNWIGAVYYKIIETKDFNNKPVYTLLGYDENNIRSNKKFIEVLTFVNGEPVFGGSYFSYPTSSLRKKFVNRYVMEYKKNAAPRLTFDNEQNMIIYEHLISETNEPQKKYTYIPDGDYEGMKWINGKWVYVEKVFTFKLNDGEAPVPSPIKENNGSWESTNFAIEDDGDDINLQPKKVKTKTKTATVKNKKKP
ncbi:hypothetical protein BH09BAC2_BH09BAC2_21040 [soil metagenome]